VFERPGLVRDGVYQHLRDAILAGDFTPGDKLGEADLVARLGVSRTPIREALQRLVQEGLLAASANRGVWVRVLTEREARDTYEVRETLDGLAAELAAKHHTEEDAARLTAALHALEAAGSDYREQTRLDLAFHREVVLSAHNGVLSDLARTLEQRVALIKHLTRTYNAHPDTTRQHHAILHAVLARDPNAARDAARAHVRTFAALVLSELEPTHTPPPGRPA
jgi:DNA-binding GntR family transcriptional regulator